MKTPLEFSFLSFRAESRNLLLFLNPEISRDVSRSTRCARSGQALDMADAPLLNGCNVTLPLDMTESLRAHC